MTLLQIAFVVAPIIAMAASAVLYVSFGEAAALSIFGAAMLADFIAAVLCGRRD
ncbi:hypothetical protein KXS07_34245 [Inquilinus limosus]|uniref:hypothetical protein n=1 Tax=Inquilinus limosus TaxID=171674 RepID=UPI003F146456